MKHTEFNRQRQELHFKMGCAYSKFLNFAFIQNADDADLQLSLNEARIKFLSTYFVTHARISPIFDHRSALLKRISADRRYIIADYYSEQALQGLRKFPGKGLHLAFEHVIPKDLLRKECEARARNGDVPSPEEIKEKLDQTWHIAVVTKEEDRQLLTARGMPEHWRPGEDILARYRLNKVETRFKLFRTIEDDSQCRVILNAA